jgi:hypothetical protein
LKEYYIEKRNKDIYNMRAQDRVNLASRIDKQMRNRKESNIINLVNQQTSKMKKG